MGAALRPIRPILPQPACETRGGNGRAQADRPAATPPGFAIAVAVAAGVPEAQIMAQTGHKSLPVLRGYIRRGSLFLDNAAAKVGL
jgi:hypothetical protein